MTAPQQPADLAAHWQQWIYSQVASGQDPAIVADRLVREHGWHPQTAHQWVSAAHAAVLRTQPRPPFKTRLRLIHQRSTPLGKKLLLASIGLWWLALALPAYLPAGPDDRDTLFGAECFVAGLFWAWLPLGYWVAWWANPLALISILKSQSPNRVFARITSLIAGNLALVGLVLDELPTDEGLTHYDHYQPGPGVVLWALAIVAAAALPWLRQQPAASPAGR